MEPHEQPWVRLPLDGAFNVRELGGYPTANGGRTCYHRFLRGDSLSRVSERDKRFLYDYGVRTVIDLRDPSEVEDAPDLRIAPDVAYANIPLLGFNMADLEQINKMIEENTFTAEKAYQYIVENYDGVRECFRTLAEAPHGCVLFHCAAGKDRTGILAMLLLGLAGVDKWDIVANYVQTWPNLMRDDAFAQRWYASEGNVLRDGMESAPRFIAYAYDLVEVEHGGVESYLLECGVPDEDVASVRARMLS